jgi:DNA-binding beta-propeller fold protein YncE
MKQTLGFLVVLWLVCPLCAEESPPVTLKTSIPLPDVEGRFDHAAVDPETNRLFFAALGNDTLEIVDLSARKRLHTITGLKKPTGVLFLADLNLLIVANGDDGTCRFYDGTSYAERGRIKGLDDADNLRFDSKAKRVYVGYGDGTLGVIDPVTMRLTSSIPLTNHPESFQLEDDGSRIFVNVPDAKQIAVVDRVAGKVVATWPLEGVRANFPMALDEKQHRLFVGCRQPARLLAFDTQSGKRVAETPINGDVDDLFFDASTNRLLASCGEGFIDVFRFDPPSGLMRTHQFHTAAGARTGILSQQYRWFCLAVPHRGVQGAELRVYTVSAPR